MKKQELSLKEALQLDEDLWLPIRKIAGTKEIPSSMDQSWDLFIKSSPDIGIFQYYRRQIEEINPCDKSDILIYIHDIGIKIIDNLKEKLRSGRMIASGINPSGERKLIDVALWNDLHISLQQEAAATGNLRFSHLRIREFNVVASRAACETWLSLQRASDPSQLKKVLFEKARKELDGTLTGRAFNLAYSAVYGRAKGRPRKLPK